MSVALDLTTEERDHLTQILEGISRESGHPTSLNGMFSEWRAFVAAVERGYEDSIYEYTNALSVRDRLEKVLQVAPPALRAKLQDALAPVDGRFAAATEDAVRPLSETAGPLPLWWHRVPQRRTGELAEDLETLGHLG